MRHNSPPGARRANRAGNFDDVLWRGNVDAITPGPLRAASSDGGSSLPWYGDPVELSPTERGALLALAFERGGCYTVADLAARFGMTVSGTRRALHTLSRVLPIANFDGYWHRADNTGAEGITGAGAKRGRKARNSE